MGLQKVYKDDANLIAKGYYNALVVLAEEGSTASCNKPYVKVHWQVLDDPYREYQPIEEMFWQDNERSMQRLTAIYNVLVSRDDPEIHLDKLLEKRAYINVYIKEAFEGPQNALGEVKKEAKEILKKQPLKPVAAKVAAKEAPLDDTIPF